MTARRAFTLIELLVVIGIIVVVIAIVLPALGGAREAARSAATQQLMTNIKNATEAFTRDNDRLPGYFTPKEVGNIDNARANFSAAQNVMIDLAGGLVSDGSGEDPAQGRHLVGPRPGSNPDDLVVVDVDLIGVEQDGNNVYFTPDVKNFVSQHPSVQGVPGRQGDANAVANNEGNLFLPSLIDSFGVPLLIWVQDPSVGSNVPPPGSSQATNTTPQFARPTSGAWTGGQPRPASFYWASNAAFLQATAVGPKGLNQAEESLFGLRASPEDRDKTLTALLGHPAFPNANLNTTNAADGGLPLDDLGPTTPRAPFMIQSAGRDGIYVAIDDGGDALEPGEVFLRYSTNFYTAGGTPDPANRYKNNKGEVVTEDILDRFDDMIVGSGQ